LHKDKVPAEWKKANLSEWSVTEELKEYETKILGARENS
jgi:hypothetical protein